MRIITVDDEQQWFRIGSPDDNTDRKLIDYKIFSY